jgi:hypothetical protein
VKYKVHLFICFSTFGEKENMKKKILTLGFLAFINSMQSQQNKLWDAATSNDLNIPAWRFGRVGIGTNNPAAHLHIFTDGSTNYSFLMEQNTTGSYGLGITERVKSNNTKAFHIENNASPPTIIDAFKVMGDGRTLLGLTNSDPVGLLHLFTPNSNGYNLFIEQNTVGGVGLGITTRVKSTSTKAYHLEYNNGSTITESFKVYGDGRTMMGITNNGPSALLHLFTPNSTAAALFIEHNGTGTPGTGQLTRVKNANSKAIVVESNNGENNFEGFKVYGDGRTKIGITNTDAQALLHLYTDPAPGYGYNLFIEENSTSGFGIGQTTRVKNNNTKAITVENNVGTIYEPFKVLGDGRVIASMKDNSATALLIQNSSGNPTYDAFKVSATGKTQIGDHPSNTHPDAMLAVKGKIVCSDFYVTSAATDWADFVFANNYRLRDLLEVKRFYIENKHLPDVPTAEEIKEKGINLGQMSVIQMQKIEELTIYMVQMKEEIEQLKSENTLLKSKLK